jgi:2,4-dienoyl-CoA reductase-like NADH-dependent reductase (Old Yellow Enzyme family)
MIWFEANAVCPEGRTNPGQMMLTESNLGEFKAFLAELRQIAKEECGISPIFICQLTHSGRQSVRPITMYKNATYESRGRGGDIASDEYLDTLPYFYDRSARLAEEVGFDGVDVKACHGYLLSEAFSAYTREGKYGGSYENRTKLYKDCFNATKAAISSRMLLTARLGLCDMVAYPDGFGTDEKCNEALDEPLRLVSELDASGLDILNITIGNPYYNPHINRPYKKGGYIPPEQPEEGLRRFIRVSSAVKSQNPGLAVVISGLSYYGADMLGAAGRMIKDGVCDLAGFGRMILAYPEFYRDHLSGNFDTKKLCLLCSKCTELMRAKQVSGCAIHDEYYRELYKREVGNKK